MIPATSLMGYTWLHYFQTMPVPKGEKLTALTTKQVDDQEGNQWL